jgi:hypothetical protein
VIYFGIFQAIGQRKNMDSSRVIHKFLSLC